MTMKESNHFINRNHSKNDSSKQSIQYHSVLNTIENTKLYEIWHFVILFLKQKWRYDAASKICFIFAIVRKCPKNNLNLNKRNAFYCKY